MTRIILPPWVRAEPVNTMAYRFHDPVMFYGNSKEFCRWNWGPWCSHTAPLVWGLKCSCYYLGLSILFLVLTSASTFGTLFRNPICKDPTLLGNHKSFMSLCIALGINHMASTYICIIHKYSNDNTFTQKAKVNGGHQAPSRWGLQDPLNQPRRVTSLLVHQYVGS